MIGRRKKRENKLGFPQACLEKEDDVRSLVDEWDKEEMKEEGRTLTPKLVFGVEKEDDVRSLVEV